MSGQSVAVACHGVSKFFGTTPALENVNILITQGERVALLGASGAGKSTLLRICAGILTADNGETLICGNDLSRLAVKPRSHLVGMLPQQFDLVGPLRARHNIQAGLLGRWGRMMSLAALLLPLESPTASELATQLGLGNKLTQRTDRLSGGEQQRVAMARLLLQKPLVLLADEPVASQDVVSAENIFRLLSALTIDTAGCTAGGSARDTSGDTTRDTAGAATTHTLLMSLHNPSHARLHADRILGLKHGRLVLDAPSSEVSDQHLEKLYG